ncbi:MAG: calcium-binding protein [Hyphomicrobiales bacterium]
MSVIQHQQATQPTDTWPANIDPTNYTLTNYRGTGWVFDFPGDGGTHFWALMTSATIVAFGQSNGAYGDPARQDIFTATTAVSSVDFYAILNTTGATGQDIFNLLMGGDDTITGSAGDDLLLAGLGSDTVTGGDGADQFDFQAGTHHVTDLGAGGADSLKVSDGALVTCDAVADWAATAATVNSGTVIINTNGFIIDLTYADAADGTGYTVTSAGLATSVVSTGSGSDDTLIGGLAADQLFGGAGGDVLRGGAGDDLLDGGAGSDTADFSAATKVIRVDLAKTGPQNTGDGKDTLVSIENVTGGARADRLTGDDNANILAGGDGNDILTGKGGSDTLNGGKGADKLVGGDGDDVLIGGAGKDVMSGGAGSDSFVYLDLTDSVAGRNRDVISGFNSAEGDVIDFRDINAPHGFYYHGGKAFTHEAGEIIYNKGLLQVDADGDGKADFQISVTIADPLHSILY